MIRIIMTQYTLKTGLRKIKEQGQSAFTKELIQLHVLETSPPVDANKPTNKKRAEEMTSLMFLKKL